MIRRAIALSLVALMGLLSSGLPLGAQESAPRVRALKVTLLSTMLADEGIGEWGFAALVEVDGQKVLFDTGARPRTVLENARELKIDLAAVPTVVLSHNHADHTGGLLTLRRELQSTNPEALKEVHVGRGLFWSRPTADGGDRNLPLKTRADYEAAGLTFVEHEKPARILPGVWVTGPPWPRCGRGCPSARRR